MNKVETSIDPRLWHACAGRLIQMPLPNSHVYYFPQGHAEHTHTNVNFGEMPRVSPSILCKVIDVKFLAHLELEEVYAKIVLHPLKDGERNSDDTPTVSDKLSYFAKKLTRTDAIGGPLSVPRDKAESIFPKLDYSKDTSSQSIIAKDIHGENWEFKHVSRGTRGRHTLTAGWAMFLRMKNLVAGNSVVFTNAENGEICVGIMHAKVMDINSSGRGKLRPEDVIKAASLAVDGQEFEITYYPRVSSPEFVVNASSVDAAVRAQWQNGIRVAMDHETENFPKIAFMGTVSSVEDVDPLLWPESPWRRLQINWDDLKHEKRVSPWLVTILSTNSGDNLKINNDKLIEVTSITQCEVFLESDDYCYGTLDLGFTNKYEEVEETLQDWFAINKFDDSTYVIYSDLAGVTKRMREELYNDFEKKAKKLTIVGGVRDHDKTDDGVRYVFKPDKLKP